MAGIKLIRTESGIERSLTDIVSRGKSVDAFLNRVTFGQYKQAQVQRFSSNNSTEGAPWAELTEKYRVRKLKKCSKFPGAGRVIMIATGTLMSAASGRSSSLLKVVSNSGIQVRIDSSAIPYAPYPGIKRPFMRFSQSTEKKMVDDVFYYIMTGRS